MGHMKAATAAILSTEATPIPRCKCGQALALQALQVPCSPVCWHCDNFPTQYTAVSTCPQQGTSQKHVISFLVYISVFEI